MTYKEKLQHIIRCARQDDNFNAEQAEALLNNAPYGVVDFEMIHDAWDMAITVDGQLWAHYAGDQGFAPTGINIGRSHYVGFYEMIQNGEIVLSATKDSITTSGEDFPLPEHLGGSSDSPIIV